jgi:hypothetical protein
MITGVSVGLGAGVGDAVAVAVAVAVGRGVEVGDCVGVGVDVGVALGAGVGVNVAGGCIVGAGGEALAGSSLLRQPPQPASSAIRSRVSVRMRGMRCGTVLGLQKEAIDDPMRIMPLMPS